MDDLHLQHPERPVGIPGGITTHLTNHTNPRNATSFIKFMIALRVQCFLPLPPSTNNPIPSGFVRFARFVVARLDSSQRLLWSDPW